MPDHEDSIANEGDIVTSLGMTYMHIPVPWGAPTEGHLREFSGYMEALQNHRGLSAEDSATPILKQWIPKMDDNWKQFLKQAGGQL